MSKKAAKKAEIAQSRQEAEKTTTNYVIAGIEFFAVSAIISTILSFIMSGAADFGTVFTVAGAIVCALCYSRKLASFSTLMKISVIFGVCSGLFTGAAHIAYLYAATPDAILLFEENGLQAIELATGIAPLDSVRAFLMHLLFNSNYHFVFNIGFAGILDVALSLAAYIIFFYYMVKRLVAKEE